MTPEFKKPAMIRPVRRNPVSSRQFSPELNRYERMPYRQCGASGLKLPAISVGAWETFGGYRGPEVARDCIFAAFNLGINLSISPTTMAGLQDEPKRSLGRLSAICRVMN
jgi:hypothetical protein